MCNFNFGYGGDIINYINYFYLISGKERFLEKYEEIIKSFLCDFLLIKKIK